ncbi:MAG: pentapeptide repeat-containing protein [Nitrososphaeraceae archaeon]
MQALVRKHRLIGIVAAGADLAEADLKGSDLNRAILVKTNQHIPCEGSAIFNIRCKKRGAVIEQIITEFT